MIFSMNTSLFFFCFVFFFWGGEGGQDPLTPLICPCYPSIFVYLSIYGGIGGQGPRDPKTNWQGMGPQPPPPEFFTSCLQGGFGVCGPGRPSPVAPSKEEAVMKNGRGKKGLFELRRQRAPFSRWHQCLLAGGVCNFLPPFGKIFHSRAPHTWISWIQL